MEKNNVEEKKEMSNWDIAYYIFMIFLSIFGFSLGIIVFMFPNETYPISFMYFLGTINLLIPIINLSLLYYLHKAKWK